MDMGCKGNTISGEPCGATLYRDSYCYWHHPDLEVERKAARAAGGKARANTSRARKRILAAARDLHEVDAALCGALDDVLSGKIEPPVASAAATIARAIVAVRTASDIESRLARLEQAAGLPERSPA